MRERRIVSIALVGAVFGVMGVGQARLTEPPGAHLRHDGDRIQRALEMARCWAGESGGMGCSESRPFDWPAADQVQAGDRLRLRVDWRRKPQKVFIDDYREV